MVYDDWLQVLDALEGEAPDKAREDAQDILHSCAPRTWVRAVDQRDNERQEQLRAAQ